MAELASQALFDEINHLSGAPLTHYADVELILRDSTRIIDNGPLGEHAVSPDSIRLSKEEKQLLRTGNYRVAISFHYTGTAWAALHQKGIRDELEQYGIDIISTMDAHFDPALQNMQMCIRDRPHCGRGSVPARNEAPARSFHLLQPPRSGSDLSLIHIYMAVAKNLIIWAIPGALLQAIGGSSRQLGVLFATGLLIASPMAGITVMVGLLIRYIVVKKYGDLGQSKLYILGAGFITGAALYSFFSSTMNLGKKDVYKRQVRIVSEPSKIPIFSSPGTLGAMFWLVIIC